MNIVYKTKTGETKTIENVLKFYVSKTQARKLTQFAPVALPPKYKGQGGQNEWVLIQGDDMELCRRLNPAPTIRQFLWGHTHGESIYWIEKREVRRVDEILKKIPRKRRPNKAELARVLCWPAIAIMMNIIYVAEIKGEWSRVIGIPADADMSLITQEEYPGWIHTLYNPRGQLIWRGGFLSHMPLFDRVGRPGKAKGGLWIRNEFISPLLEEGDL